MSAVNVRYGLYPGDRLMVTDGKKKKRATVVRSTRSIFWWTGESTSPVSTKLMCIQAMLSWHAFERRTAMSEALLLVAEGYEQIAAGIRKMIAAEKDTPKKDEKPVKKAEKKEAPVADTPKEEPSVDRKTVRAFLAEKSRSGKTSEVKNLIAQFGFQKLSDVPDDKLPELYEKAQVL